MLTKRFPAAAAVVLAVLATALIAGCTASGGQASLSPAHPAAPSFTWTSTPLRDASSALSNVQTLGLAADDTSFVLAGLGPSGPDDGSGICTCTTPTVYSSEDDGATWRQATVPRLTGLAQQPIAGYAGRLYLLGDTDTRSGPALAVWTSSDGLHWSFLGTLPGSTDPQLTANGAEIVGAGITADSGGVEVFVEDNTIIDFLHAADGAHFSLAASGSPNSYGTVHALSPDGSGYLLLAGGGVYSSIDGANWTDETSALPVNTANWGTYAGVGNDGTVVVAGWTTSLANGISQVNETWTQTSQPNGPWSGSYDLDPGRLPEPGVGPIGSQNIDAIVPLGTGFLATGYGTSDLANDNPKFFAAVWYSANGRTWAKQPETTTGFEHAFSMWGAAVKGTHIVLVGYAESRSGEETGLLMWRGVFTT